MSEPAAVKPEASKKGGKTGKPKGKPKTPAHSKQQTDNEGVQGNENPKEQGAPERAPQQEQPAPESAPKPEEPTSTHSRQVQEEPTPPRSETRAAQLAARREDLIELDPEKHKVLLGKLEEVAEEAWDANMKEQIFVDAAQQAAEKHGYAVPRDIRLDEDAIKAFQDANGDMYSETSVQGGISAMPTSRSQHVYEHPEKLKDPENALQEIEKLWAQVKNARATLRISKDKIEADLRKAVEEKTGGSADNKSVEVNGVNFKLTAEHTEMRPNAEAKAAIAAMKQKAIAERPEDSFPSDAQITSARAGLNAAIERAEKMGQKEVGDALKEVQKVVKLNGSVCYSFPANIPQSLHYIGDAIKELVGKVEQAKIGDIVSHLLIQQGDSDILGQHNPLLQGVWHKFNGDLTRVCAGVKAPETTEQWQAMRAAIAGQTDKQINAGELLSDAQKASAIKQRDLYAAMCEQFKDELKGLKARGVKVENDLRKSLFGDKRYARFLQGKIDDCSFKGQGETDTTLNSVANSYGNMHLKLNPELLWYHLSEKTLAAMQHMMEFARSLPLFADKTALEWALSHQPSGAQKANIQHSEAELGAQPGKLMFNLRAWLNKHHPDGDKIADVIEKVGVEQAGNMLHQFIGAHLAANEIEGYGAGKGAELIRDLLQFQKDGTGMTEADYRKAYIVIARHLSDSINTCAPGLLNKFAFHRHPALKFLDPLSTVKTQQGRLISSMVKQAGYYYYQSLKNPDRWWEYTGKAVQTLGAMSAMRAAGVMLLGRNAMTKEEKAILHAGNLKHAYEVEDAMDYCNLVHNVLHVDLGHIQPQMFIPWWNTTDMITSGKENTGRAGRAVESLKKGQINVSVVTAAARGLMFAVGMARIRAVDNSPIGMEVAVTKAKEAYEGIVGKAEQGAYRDINALEAAMRTNAQIKPGKHNFETNMLWATSHIIFGGHDARLADFEKEWQRWAECRDRDADEFPELHKVAEGKGGGIKPVQAVGIKPIEGFGATAKKEVPELPLHPAEPDWIRIYQEHKEAYDKTHPGLLEDIQQGVKEGLSL